MNDLTELHQHEIENIKSGVNDMEDKVQYQSEERLLDIKEHLQTLETKVGCDLMNLFVELTKFFNI